MSHGDEGEEGGTRKRESQSSKRQRARDKRRDGGGSQVRGVG